MSHRIPLAAALGAGLLLLAPAGTPGQTLRVSFDSGVKANWAAGRAEPWLSKGVELVPGRFGQAARVGERGQLVYAGEQNLLAGRGTLAFWCKVPKRPGPHDVQRLVFVQTKERGYWTYLATLEWQESAFRAMVFDVYHGHGWHDPAGLPSFKAETWHHLALVWDQAQGVKFYLDGRPAGSSWGGQAWWERPTPHAIHLCYPGATYDELCVYDEALGDADVAALARGERRDAPAPAGPPGEAERRRLADSLRAVGLEHLPSAVAGEKPGKETVIRQAVVGEVRDDRIPAWKVVDGRMNLFWPEWRAPTLGDVDYSGSELNLELQPGEKPTCLVLRGLAGGCRVFTLAGGAVSREPVFEVPQSLHFLAAHGLPAEVTGLRIPRREGMKLHELGLYAVTTRASAEAAAPLTTPFTGALDLGTLGPLADDIRTRTLPHERTVLGKAANPARKAHAVAGLSRVHFLSEPVGEATPLDAVSLRLTFTAPWAEDVWWLRVQDPVNPRRDLIHLPVRVTNPMPGKETVLEVTLDFWDVMLDPGARLWVELLPSQGVSLVTGGADVSRLVLRAGESEKVLKEFARTQGQLAYSYWQLGSEAGGTRGADPKDPGFALLGSITHNRELKLTLEWVRRHAPDHALTNNLWKITFGKPAGAPVTPRTVPGAPEWAVWGRELLGRFRSMAHHWADRQGADGQLGGGWNDDTDFPGVFICLPLLGDTKTQRMFARVFDGLERTGYLDHGVARGPTDALHATDFLSWRAHLMLFDYGEPRHVERALTLTRELRDRWTKLDEQGHRRFLTGYYSEDGPGRRPNSKVDDSGLIEQLRPGEDTPTNRNFLRDPIFCAWYARNPSVLRFVREVAEGDYEQLVKAERASEYQTFPLLSYYTLLGEKKYLGEPLDRFLRGRGSLPLWRRLSGSDRADKQVLAAAKKGVNEDQLATAYWITKDRSYLVRGLRDACERLEGGWQFRGGEAGGANDHFSVPGQAVLSQMYLGAALTWLRPASILPPLAVSWQGLDAEAAALVLDAGPRSLRVALYNFDDRPRAVRMRVWELAAGTYRLREGADRDQDDKIDEPGRGREVELRRATPVDLTLPAREVYVVELEQVRAGPRPELLPDLAVGEGDVFYDKATDRLKVVVHNIGSAAAQDVRVRFETPDGQLLREQTIPRLEAPLDLRPKTAVAYLPQPTLLPVERIVVRIDPDGRIDEITRENNVIGWRR